MKNKKYFFIVIGIVLVLVLYLWLFKSKYSIFDRYKAIYYSLDFDNEFVLKNIENEGGVLKYVIEGKGDYSKVVSRINEYLQLNLESDICGMKISVCFWDDICKWNYIVFDNYSFYSGKVTTCIDTVTIGEDANIYFTYDKKDICVTDMNHLIFSNSATNIYREIELFTNLQTIDVTSVTDCIEESFENMVHELMPDCEIIR